MMTVFLMAGTTVAIGAFRSANRSGGIVTLETVNYAINPDDTTASKAHLLGSEMSSLAAQSQFAIVLGSPLAATDAPNWQQLRNTTGTSLLADATASEIEDPGAMTTLLSNAGAIFDLDSGYSLMFIGQNLRVLGIVTVSQKALPDSSGNAFRVYSAKLFGDDSNGFGLLYSYAFASPDTSAQPVSAPAISTHIWTVTLPDPSVPTEKPNGDPLSTPESSQIHEICTGISGA